MRVMFVYSLPRKRGYAGDVRQYIRIAEKLGHEVVLYGRDWPGASVPRSTDIEAADGVVVIMEWFFKYQEDVDKLRRLLDDVPRERRVIFDSDGRYNDVVRVEGDYNHLDAASSRKRMALCDELADKICQPTLHPLRSDVGTFLFSGYDPDWEVPFAFGGKPFGMFYVGNNWFRWLPMKRVLKAVEEIREDIGRIGIVGHGWDAIADSVDPPLRDHACFTDPTYLKELEVELLPPVPVTEVVPSMGQGVFNPVLARRLFNHLKLVTPRMFESVAANSIPLLVMDRQFACEIYGEAAAELVLREDAGEQIFDIIDRPTWYAEAVRAIREHLRAEHSYSQRFRQLMKIIES